MKKFSVTFNDLSEKTQKQIVLEDKSEAVLRLALNSEHQDVRILALKQNEITSEMLDDFIFSREEISKEECMSVFFHPNFKESPKNLEFFASCDIHSIQKKVASSLKATSSLLNEMLLIDNADVIESIITNPNFEKTPDSLTALTYSYSWKVRMIPAEDPETPENVLQDFLFREFNEDVLNAILRNIRSRNINISIPNSLIPNEIIRKVLKSETSSQELESILNAQLKQEGKMNLFIIEEVFKNPNLIVTDDIKRKKDLFYLLKDFSEKHSSIQTAYSKLLKFLC